MKRGGGSKKGSAFERLVCKILSNWWTQGNNDAVFWRTHGSGSRATQYYKKNGRIIASQIGDVCSTTTEGTAFRQAFVVSIKRGYKRFTIHDIVDGLETHKESALLEWIRECMTYSIQAKSIAWLLIMQRDRRKPLVVFPGYFLLKLKPDIRKALEKSVPSARVVFKVSDKRGYSSVSVMPLEDFLSLVSREVIEELVEKENGKYQKRRKRPVGTTNAKET